MSGPPLWADLLLRRVFGDHGRPAPKLAWRHRRPSAGSGVSGHAYHDRHLIQIMQGPRPWTHEGPWELVDRELVAVMLHECAHILMPRRCGHSKTFWQTAWRLHGEYGDLLTAARLEFSYRKGAERYAPAGVAAAYSPERCRAEHPKHGRCTLRVGHPAEGDWMPHLTGGRWWEEEEEWTG